MKKLNVKKRVATILLAVLAAVSLGLACFFMSTPNTNVVGANQSAHSTAFGVPSGHDGESATSTALSESNISSGVITIASPGSYYLSADLDARIEVDLSESEEENKTVHLCLNGHILNAGGTDSAVKVRENTTLVLHDCGSTTHYYTEGSDGAYDFDGVTSETDNAQSLTGGVITGGSATNGGGVYVENGASFIMLGGNISGNTATQAGGGVYYASGSSGGTFEYSDITNSATNLTATGLAGGRIIGNAVTGDEVSGGGVYTAASLTLSGVEISNNTVNSVDNNRGGGVAIYGSSSSPITVTMTGGTISGNSAPLGGGVSVRNHATFTLSAGEISENSAPRATSGHGNDNSAHSSGGGVNVGSNGTFNMSGGSISGNISGNDSNDNDNDYGGGVYVYAGTFTMTGGTISGNEADDGGGIYVNSADKIENNNGALLVGGVDVVISNNIARHNGGGIYLNRHSQATINGATIGGSSDDLSNGNYAQSFGGGIYINRGDAEMVILKATITYNQAMTGGGAYVHSGNGDSGSLVLGNSSNTAGGAPDVTIQNNSAIYYRSRPTEKMNGYGGGVFMRNAGDAGTSYESNIDIFGYVIITENDSLPDGQVKAAADNLYLEDGIAINEHTTTSSVDGEADTGNTINTNSKICITLAARDDNYYNEPTFIVGDTYGDVNKIFKPDAPDAVLDVNPGTDNTNDGDSATETVITYHIDADADFQNYTQHTYTDVFAAIAGSGTTFGTDGEKTIIQMNHLSSNIIFGVKVPFEGDIVYAKISAGILQDGTNAFVEPDKNTDGSYKITEIENVNYYTFTIPYSMYSATINVSSESNRGIHIIYTQDEAMVSQTNQVEQENGGTENVTTSIHLTIEDAFFYASNLTYEDYGTDDIIDNPATITLLLNADTAQTLTVSDSDVVTLDLNGHVLSMASGSTGSVISVTTGANFTLTDGGDDASNTVNGTAFNGGVLVGSTGTLAESITRGGGVYVNDATFNMTGGTITGGTAQHGAGVYVTASGNFNMSKGSITGNNTGNGNDHRGGGIYIASGTLSMSGTASVTDNLAGYGGGGIFFAGISANNTIEFTLKDNAKISGNSAQNGAGVFVGLYVDFEMSGGTISGNTATNGGGVYLNTNANFAMSGGTIGGTESGNGNTASVNGGGVYIVSGATFNMSGGMISGNNTASGTNHWGGGVYVVGKFTMSGTATISGNTSSSHGGGVFTTGTFTMEAGTISGNTADGDCGGGGEQRRLRERCAGSKGKRHIQPFAGGRVKGASTSPAPRGLFFGQQQHRAVRASSQQPLRLTIGRIQRIVDAHAQVGVFLAQRGAHAGRGQAVVLRSEAVAAVGR